jgi:hypothetical protein
MLFPELEKEIGVVLKDVLSKVARPGFHRAKERVIIAESFFNEQPGIAENHRREIVVQIKAAGDSKELNARLKGWEASPAKGSSSLFSILTSLFVSKEQTSKSVDDAARRSRNTKDFKFLASLPEKVSKEPLLDQLAQDAIIEAYRYLREFMQRRLPRFYSRVYDIKQKAMYRQVDLGGYEQDRQRKMFSRSEWFNEIKMAQAHVKPVYVCVVHRCT